MRRRSLTELANNPDLIPGVYNYCDRWCERCPLTSRCLVYATEQQPDDDSPESQDIRNESFWKRLGTVFQETREMIDVWAKQAGVDFIEPIDQDEPRHRRKRQLVDNHPLTRSGKKYANAACDWFRHFDGAIELDTEEAREVIQWYQYQIAVKTIRALSGRREELEEDSELPKDSDGSAKVALIGIDRSIAGWRLMQLSLPQRADSIVPLILQLETLRVSLERSFPDARDFIRPGFD